MLRRRDRNAVRFLVLAVLATGCPQGVPTGGVFATFDAKATVDSGNVSGPDSTVDVPPADGPMPTQDAILAEFPLVQKDAVAADAPAGFDAGCDCNTDADCSGIAVATCQIAQCKACTCNVALAKAGTPCGTGLTCQAGQCLAAPKPGPWAKTVAAGGHHTCALHPDGGVSCWGSSSQGQLGNGSSSGSSNVPVAVAVLSSVSQLVTGSSHACALHSGGKVSCWGDRFNGQIGSGDKDGYAVVPEAAGTMSDALFVATGAYFSLAVRKGATLWGWGNGNGGQLLQDSLTSKSDPVQLKPILDVQSTCGGDRHACALHGDGSVACWGRNTDGQVGHGDTGQNEIIAAGTVVGLPKVIGIACGYVNTCAWDGAGKAWCWGSNISGQLATGNYGTSPVNAPVQMPASVSIAALACGQSHVCALGLGGEVACWGDNEHGQSGAAGNGDVYKANPVDLGGKANALAAGTQHSCAVRADGAVLCWGANTSGQLGNAGKDDSAAAVVVVGSQPL